MTYYNLTKRDERFIESVGGTLDGDLPAYAWPGGYPLVYLDIDNNVLCPQCATVSLWADWEENKPCHAHIHYEGADLMCDECGAIIESAYGDPDSDGEEEDEQPDAQ